MNGKPFSFWAKWIAGIWVAPFFIILFSLVVVLHFLQIGGLETAQVRETVLQLMEIYLPYLGIIFGAFAFTFRVQRWGEAPVDGMFPLLALSISALFNFLMLAWTFSFLRGTFANVEDYIADIKIFAAGMAFFIGWFLTYFFEAGHRANACCQSKSDDVSTGSSSSK